MATKIRTITLDNIKKFNFPMVIGYFGSIHVMHSQLLATPRPFSILTFTDFARKANSQLYPFEQRIDNLKQFHANYILVYDLAKGNMKAEEFIQKVLLKINPSMIIVGSNFKFGSDHKPYDLLKKYFPVQTVNQNNRVSSTIIAQLLLNKKVEKANDLLFFPYYYESEWIGGQKLGRKIGFRTVNLLIKHRIFLSEGSYISRLTIGSRKYNAITFYGKSKTRKATKCTLETHILHKHLMPRTLYPAKTRNHVKVEILKYLRPNTKYKNEKALIAALNKDKEKAKQYFERNK